MSSGIDRGSRVTFGPPDGATATAAHGDTLYVAGATQVALRAPGLATFDAIGALEQDHPELDGSSRSVAGTASRVVSDGLGGAYVVGVTGTGADGVQQPGLIHVTAEGAVDTAFRPRFATAQGVPSVDVRDVAVTGDAVYVAGGFARAGGEQRDGVAALDPATGRALAWRPSLTGVGSNAPAVSRLAVAGDRVLVTGAFSQAGGQVRDGLAGLRRGDGQPTAWAPAGLAAAAAAKGLSVDGDDNAVLASATVVQSVTTSGSGTRTELAAATGGTINAAILSDDGTVYVTGTFTEIDGTARAGLAEITLSTGVLTAWDPGRFGTTNGGALALDGDRVYVALPQDDTTLEPTPWGGVERCGVAAALRTTGAVDMSWKASVSTFDGCIDQPTSLTMSGGRVWAAGAFKLANSTSRPGALSAVDLSTDTILSWAPSLNPGALALQMAVSPDGQTLYLGGSGISDVNGVSRSSAAAVSTQGRADAAGDVRAWDPVVSGQVNDIELDRNGSGGIDRIFLGGDFYDIGGVSLTNLAAVDPTTGAPNPAWTPNPDGAVSDIELDGAGALYASGSFLNVGSQARTFLAKLDAATAVVDATWNAGIAPDAPDTYIADLAVETGTVYVGGLFDTTVGGAPRQNAAALSTSDGSAVQRWNPAPNGAVANITAASDGVLLLQGGFVGGPAFTSLGDRPRPARLGSVTADGVVTGWAPQSTTFAPAAGVYQPSHDALEVAGRTVIATASSQRSFDGVPQGGALVFAQASAPVAIDPPRIVGTPREGSQLTCEPGFYGQQVVERAYGWRRDGAAIQDETDTTYDVVAQDRGHEIDCVEIAENAVARVQTASASVRVAVNAPTNRELPEVVGEVRVGVQATCDRGLWNDFPRTYVYEWRRGGSAIAGATGETYVAVAADRGTSLSCAVRAQNEAGLSEWAVSGGRTVLPPNENPPPPPPPCTVNCDGGRDPPAPPPCTQNCGGGPTPNPPTPDPPRATAVLTIRSATARGSRLTFSVNATAAGRVAVAATAKLGRRTGSVGSASVTLRRAGAATITVNLTRAAQRAIARQRGRRLTVTVRLTYTPAVGQASTVTRRIVVRASAPRARRKARIRAAA